jgi:predicted ester cyclase
VLPQIGRSHAFQALEEFDKIGYFVKAQIKEVLVDGDRIIMRSEGSGTPVGPLIGNPDSGKSFKLMAIEIHIFKNGKAFAQTTSKTGRRQCSSSAQSKTGGAVRSSPFAV